MSKDKDEIQIAIYQINRDNFVGLKFEQITEQIVDEHNSKFEEKSWFELQKLENNAINSEFDVRIYYATKTRIPKWRPFLDGVLPNDSKLAKSENTDASFICFVEHDGNIFAISGGQGNFTIQDHINQNFGLDILTRIIDENNQGIKFLQERGFSGSILGSTKTFRSNHKLSDEDQFGKIYNLVRTDINKEILIQEFGFSPSEVKRKSSSCLAKSSFQISKNVNFEKLLKIIKSITDILQKRPKFSLNNVIPITNKGKNKDLVKRLTDKFVEDIFLKYKNKQELDYDLCHKDYDKYLTSNEYNIKYGNSIFKSYEEPFTLQELAKDLDDLKMIDKSTQETFYHSFLQLNISAYDEKDDQTTKGTVLNHLHGEVEYRGKNYFYIDGNWYEIRDEFVKEINEDCEALLNEHQDNKFLEEKIDLSKDENVYNAKFLNKEGFIVLDKITHENIELCDILKYNNEEVFLVHVKKGFNNSVRELTSQIIIAANRISRDRKNSYKYKFVSALEEAAKKGSAIDKYRRQVSEQKFPEEGLKSTLGKKITKNINFCFAFADTAISNRDIKTQLTSFKSNIAKYSLLELNRVLKSLGFGFKIIQIKKE